MPKLPLKSSILKYLVTAGLITALVISARLFITWAAETFLYPVPIVGGWLKSLEIIELSVIVLFALLGFGLGGASRYLGAKTSLWMKSLVFVVAVPLVFFSSYWLRYQMWINQLAAESELPRSQIVEMSNVALSRESGSQGFWGYYRTTTKMPILPATGDELQRMTEDQKWFRSELTRFSGIEPGVFSMVFDGAGWGIRVFYMLLATITAVIYFFKGLAWADGVRLRTLTKTKVKV